MKNFRGSILRSTKLRSSGQRTRRYRALGVTALGAAVLLSACSPGEGSPAEGEALRVFAAASLNETFTGIGELFEEEHGTAVEFNFAGSSDLVAQIEQGAPADVFASADETTMDRAAEAGALDGEPRLFAANTLTIVTPAGNPAQVSSLQDLADENVVTVVCAPQVPCGAATDMVTQAAGVELTPASEETAVTDVLGKVRAGEADAGLVYTTDAQAAGKDVETIDFPESADIINRYPVSVVKGSDKVEQAEEFLDFLETPQALEILQEAGFAQP